MYEVLYEDEEGQNYADELFVAFLYEVLYEDEEGYEPERVSKNRFRAICGREKRCRSLKRGRSLRRKAELLLLSVGF